MNPLSLSQLKANLLAVMRLMVSNGGLYLDFVYKGRLYRMTIEDLNTQVVKKRRPRSRSMVDQVDAKKCPECKKLMLNGVCMNSLCSRNLAAKRSLAKV